MTGLPQRTEHTDPRAGQRVALALLRTCTCSAALFAATASTTARSDSGRDAVIEVRKTPYTNAPMRSGPYPPGSPEPEQNVDGGVRIAGQVIPQDLYEQMRSAHYVPMRRELTDEEFFAALTQEARASIGSLDNMAEWSAKKFASWRPFLFWGFRAPGSGGPVTAAEATYAEWFDEAGAFRQHKLHPGPPPAVAMMRWGGSYWNTGDERWARAVLDGFAPFYRANRPPLEPILNAKPRTMWRVLSAGSRVPTLIEAYAYVAASPEWTDDDHILFWKSMLEHGRLLRYTTVPKGPWTEFNPFGYGNWVLYQLEGLLAIAAFFPEFAEAQEWLEHARDGVGRHGDWSVLPDAGFDEYAVSYAGQVAGQLEYCWNTMMQCGIDPPPRFADNVLRLHELFLKTALPEGAQLPFGDTHRGSGSSAARRRWAALAFLDGRFKTEETAADASYIEEGARVLHPENPSEAVRTYQALASQAPPGASQILAETGWVIMRPPAQTGGATLALSYRASSRVFHSGWEMLGLNLWEGGTPLFVKLLGYKSYLSGFPEGFCRTPRQANAVLVEGATLKRVTGSLRNWHSSSQVDYLHADHRGWAEGAVTMRRRVLYIKPDWVLIVDDIEGDGPAALTWQLHTEENRPRIQGSRALVRSGSAGAQVFALDTDLAVTSYPVSGMDKTVYLLSARQEGMLPLRFISLIAIGADQAARDVAWSKSPDGHWEEATFADAEARHTVRIEGRDDATNGRSLTWRRDDDTAFSAHDGQRADVPWTALSDEPAPAAALPTRAGTIPETAITAFGYHGRPEMTAVGTAGRVSWTTEQPAMHWLHYREAGSPHWRRQLQPGYHTQAWILLPDLEPAALIDIRAFSLTREGRLLVSAPLQRPAPSTWKMLGHGYETTEE